MTDKLARGIWPALVTPFTDDGTALETARQVHEALAQLPEGQRTVIQLHWFHGLAFAEVAEVVGASVSAVKVRAHRGYKVLKGHLQVTDAPEGIGLQGGSVSGAPQ